MNNDQTSLVHTNYVMFINNIQETSVVYWVQSYLEKYPVTNFQKSLGVNKDASKRHG